MPHAIPRRTFLQGSLAAAAAFAAGPLLARGQAVGANDRLAVGSIGCGGMGKADLNQISAHPKVQIVGLCDVDERQAKEMREKFPDVPFFRDYREMFDQLGDRLDAVHVSTPDHTHAPATMTALNHGKHVYTQKPLTHDVFEARQLAKIAARKPNLATQMGIQHNSRVDKRQAIALLQDAALREELLGRIERIYGWSDRPAGWWPQGIPKPQHADPVPEGLDWNLWLGTAPKREFVEGMYAPFHWRGCFDFGCGALGDMACHILDVPYFGLALREPKSFICHCEDATDDRFPTTQTVVILYPGSEEITGGADLPLYWSDGGVRPHWKATRIAPDFDPTDNATVVVGEKGSIVCAHPEATPHYFVADRSEKAPSPYRKVDLADRLAKFEERNHYHHWIDAALGGEAPACHFEASSPMAEMLALGALSARFPHQLLQWDATAMKFTNHDAANPHLRRTYRDGFGVEHL